MDGRGASAEGHAVAAELRRRLQAGPPDRLGDAVRLIMDHAFQIVATLRPTPDELDAFVQFLTDVGYATMPGGRNGCCWPMSSACRTACCAATGATRRG